MRERGGNQVLREPLLRGREEEVATSNNPLRTGGRWKSSLEEFPASTDMPLPEKIHIFPSSGVTGFNKNAHLHAGESLDFEPVSLKHTHTHLLSSFLSLLFSFPPCPLFLQRETSRAGLTRVSSVNVSCIAYIRYIVILDSFKLRGELCTRSSMVTRVRP